MRILFLLPDNFIGGGSFVVFEHAKRLTAQGHRVVIAFAEPTANLSISAYDGMESIATIHLHQLTRTEPFDAAIATAWSTCFQITSVPSRSYVYFVQDNERRFYAPPGNRVDRYLAGQTYTQNFHFIVSAAWLQAMLRDEFGQPSSVVPYAIDPTRFQNVPPLRPRGPSLRVLVEGRAAESRKRIHLAFEVLEQVEDVEVFYVASDGFREPHWKIDEFFQKVPHRQMAAIYASCDLILKLSSQESFGLPILEMFTSGGTAVVTAYTGHDQFIINDQNALVVPIDDKHEAIRAVKKLRDDPVLLARLKAGAKNAVAQFSWDRSAELMEQALSRIIKGISDGSSPQRTPRPSLSDAVLFRYRKVPGTLRRKLAGLFHSM